MHFEVNNGRTEAQCARALTQLRAAFGNPQEEDMTPDQAARLERLERGMVTLIQQVCGEHATIDQPWPAGKGGWEMRRYGVDPQPRRSLVDMLREIDRQLNSVLSLEDRPGQDSDDAFGHVLSLRAEVQQVLEEVGGTDPAPPAPDTGAAG